MMPKNRGAKSGKVYMTSFLIAEEKIVRNIRGSRTINEGLG